MFQMGTRLEVAELVLLAAAASAVAAALTLFCCVVLNRSRKPPPPPPDPELPPLSQVKTKTSSLVVLLLCPCPWRRQRARIEPAAAAAPEAGGVASSTFGPAASRALYTIDEEDGEDADTDSEQDETPFYTPVASPGW